MDTLAPNSKLAITTPSLAAAAAFLFLLPCMIFTVCKTKVHIHQTQHQVAIYVYLHAKQEHKSFFNYIIIKINKKQNTSVTLMLRMKKLAYLVKFWVFFSFLRFFLKRVREREGRRRIIRRRKWAKDGREKLGGSKDL